MLTCHFLWAKVEQEHLSRMYRFGIWFDTTHVPYGGPSHLLIGTLLGLLQADPHCIVLLNEPGDYNWLFGGIPRLQDYEEQTVGCRNGVGPMTFGAGDAFLSTPESNRYWSLSNKSPTTYLVPSAWFGHWISQGLPFLNAGKRLAIWGGGVNTDRFAPLLRPVSWRHDFFIYFKSQNWDHLRSVHEYLFHNYFKLHGPTLTYYFYSTEELLETARNARCCIYVGCVETQGLASLEIMSCDCPLFVLDTTEYHHEGRGMTGVTTVPCWDSMCGMKSSVANMSRDFPVFMERLETYTPRTFVEREYSWKASAGKLLQLIAGSTE
jgi:hypothetical protein